MIELRSYLRSLKPDEQVSYALRCGTTIGYLRKAMSTGQMLREGLCIKLEQESDGRVSLEGLRPDVNWDYLRQRPKPVQSAPAAAQEPAHA